MNVDCIHQTANGGCQGVDGCGIGIVDEKYSPSIGEWIEPETVRGGMCVVSATGRESRNKRWPIGTRRMMC